MEHIYTIKVKREFDPRGQYPSERRYSASTVFGFAWVYLALALTTFLLACLSIYNPITNNTYIIKHDSDKNSYFNETQDFISEINVNNSEVTDSVNSLLENEIQNDTFKSDQFLPHVDTDNINLYGAVLIISPLLLALGGFVAGFAAIVASKKWYIDHSITWFFVASMFSTVLSVISFIMITLWIAEINNNDRNFCDFFSKGDILNKIQVEYENSVIENEDDFNGTLMYVVKIPLEQLRAHKIPLIGEEHKQSQTRKVLSINILIAALVELIWSLLSLKIAWNGMRSTYPDDDVLNKRRNGATVHVITEVKGNNIKHLPKNAKILPPQPDLIEHYPKNNKIKKFFQNQQENGGFFLHTNQNENGVIVVGRVNEKDCRHESDSEYRERMMNFLNKCSSNGIDSPESCIGNEPSSVCASDIDSGTVSKNQDEGKSTTMRGKPTNNKNNPNRLSVLSWGDIYDHPVYDQNTLDLDKIVLCVPKVNKDETNADNSSELVNNVNKSKE